MIKNNLHLWEILVPTIMNDKPVRTVHHKEWDKYIQKIANGLTILKPTKGKWLEPIVGKLHEERVIPVRIACTRNQINLIINFTINHYNQKAVMAYKLSEEVIIKFKDEKKI